MAYERKYKVTKGINDIYRAYKKEKIVPDLDASTFKKVLYEINQTIMDLIIRESLEYRIPYRLGFLRIKKNKMKLKLKDGRIDVTRNMIDWKATLDYWEEVYGTRDRKVLKTIPNKKTIFQTNEHTDGDSMRLYWDKSFTIVKNKSIYLFAPVKGGVVDGKYHGRHGLRDWIYSNEKKNDYYY